MDLVLSFASQDNTQMYFRQVYNPGETAAMLTWRPERLGHMCYLDEQLSTAFLHSGLASCQSMSRTAWECMADFDARQ